MSIEIARTESGFVEYSSTGTGQPILFVHGGHSNCEETLFQKGFDTEKFRLITPSRPGYGNTPLASGASPEDAATLLNSFLDSLDLEKVIVIGVSAGGLTAVELAAKYPAKVEKLILISAVTKKWLQPEDPMYKKGKMLFSEKMEKYSWGMYRFFFRLFPGLMSTVMLKELTTTGSFRLSSDEIDELRDMVFSQRSYSGFVNDLDQNIAPQTIKLISCETLILHSQNDAAVSVDMAHHAEANIKNATLKVYDNTWGHLLWLGEESKQPIADVMGFVF